MIIGIIFSRSSCRAREAREANESRASSERERREVVRRPIYVATTASERRRASDGGDLGTQPTLAAILSGSISPSISTITGAFMLICSALVPSTRAFSYLVMYGVVVFSVSSCPLLGTPPSPSFRISDHHVRRSCPINPAFFHFPIKFFGCFAVVQILGNTPVCPFIYDDSPTMCSSFSIVFIGEVNQDLVIELANV